jgi:hypothetical protein
MISLNLLLSNPTNFNIFIYSPLDQFGADNISGDILSFIKCSFIDTFDIFSLDELFDTSFLQSLYATFVSTYFYDDDDCADSE